MLQLSVLYRQGCCNVALVAESYNRLGSTRLLWSRHGRTRLFNVPLIGRAAREPLWSVVLGLLDWATVRTLVELRKNLPRRTVLQLPVSEH